VEALMMIDLEQTGTIDWLVVEFPGKELGGTLLPPMLDLVDRHLIRVLDVVVVLKGEDGSVEALTTDDLDKRHVGDLGSLAGASSGLISDEDVAEVATALDEGTASLLLVYENLWSIPFATAARKAGGQLVASGRIPVQAVLAALDALEALEA
jgi:uncharacterized membrane protein